MKKNYQIAEKTDTREVAEYLVRHREHLLPMQDVEGGRNVRKVAVNLR